MAKRNRFIAPEVVRIQLAEVQRRAHQLLITTGPPQPDGKPARPATAAEIETSAARVRQAEEDADWIDVKAELNAGEARQVYTDLVVDMRQGERVQLDPKKVGLTKILAYVVGWSFTDATGKPVPFSEAALLNLSPEDYAEVDAAVSAHETTSEKARAERKNGQGSASSLSPA